MTSEDFKIQAMKFRVELMNKVDANGVTLYGKVPELKAELHYDTWRDVLDTCGPYDFIPALSGEDRFFGCLIRETPDVPVGKVRFSVSK